MRWFRPVVRRPPTSRALGAAEALVDPVQGLHPVGGVDAFGREHPHAREHVLLLLRVELYRPVERILDGLVAATDRHRDAPARRVELEVLEGSHDVLHTRPPAGRLDRLLVGGLHPLEGLDHVIAPVGRPTRLPELLRAALDELLLERILGGVGHLGPVRAAEPHHEPLGQVPKLLEEERRVVVDDEALAEEPADPALAIHRGEVRSPEAVEDHVGLGGEKLRDLGRQVALEELGPEGLDHLDVGLELAEGADEDRPRVAPPMPPSSVIFSTQASAAFFAGIPKVLEAGPESSVTMPTRSSLGAPATLEGGVWVAAGGDRTAIRVSTLSAVMLARRFFIMLSL